MLKESEPLGIAAGPSAFYASVMLAPPIPDNEQQRLDDLRRLGLVGSPPEERFDQLTRLATRVLGVPTAYIALVDANRQFMKSAQNVPVCKREIPRDQSFCGHTIAAGEPLIIEDASADERFADNPLVTGEPYVRFYAGFPLRGPNGHLVATLCVVDSRPRKKEDVNLEALAELAKLAERELGLVGVIEAQEELLAARAERDAAQRRLAHELEAAGQYVTSLLPAPTSDGPVRFDWRFDASSAVGGDLFGYHALPDGRTALYLLDVSGHGVGASLHSASVFQTIRNMTLPGVNWRCPEAVLTALNRAFPMEQNDGKFVTLWYGVYHPDTRTLRYCAAGHHPASLFVPGVEEVTALGEPGLMIGVDADFAYHAREVALMPGARLYLYSDGAFEVRRNDDPDEPMLGIDGLAAILAKHAHHDPAADANPDAAYGPSASRLDRVVADLHAHLGHARFDDDFTLLEATFV